MNAQDYIRKGELWCIEHACQIDWDIFECEQTVFSKEFQEDFRFEIKHWTLNGKLHREDGPAVIWPDGAKYWFLNGMRHREDGPAVEYAHGAKEWWVNGELHREGGPARIWTNGDKEWFLNGKLHREGGPAIEWASGTKHWYLNGQLHREDGPAIEWPGGSKEWWVNERKLTKSKWEKEVLKLNAGVHRESLCFKPYKMFHKFFAKIPF